MTFEPDAVRISDIKQAVKDAGYLALNEAWVVWSASGMTRSVAKSLRS